MEDITLCVAQIISQLVTCQNTDMLVFHMISIRREYTKEIYLHVVSSILQTARGNNNCYALVLHAFLFSRDHLTNIN